MVRIDNNFDDYVTQITEHEKYNQLTIKDVKFHHLSYYTFENILNIKYLPDVITIIVYGKTIQEYMKCTVFLGYEKIEKIKGFFRKKKYFEEILRIKGFKLEPTSHSSELDSVPCLTSYRADIGKDNAFDIKKKGIVFFGTGSHSAESQHDSARQSITCVLVASDEKPFVSSVRKKGSIFLMKSDSNGINEEIQDVGKKIDKKTTIKHNDPITILKIRLAKGEITKKEYDELKKMLEE